MAIVDPAMQVTLGLSIWGDVGPLTYQSRRGNEVVVYEKAPPTTPPTQRQLLEQQKMIDAAEAWHTLPAAKRRQWLDIAASRQVVEAPFCLFFFFFGFGGSRDAYMHTLARQTGLPDPLA